MYLHVSYIAAVILLVSSTSALIVPEEIVSLLSIVYSNIPPIRKGTDSRLGLGFRLGNSADVQFLVELGPQVATAPIGPQRGNTGSSGSAPASSFKRQVYPDVTAGSNWLSKWRANIDRRNGVAEMTTRSTVEEKPKRPARPYYVQNRLFGFGGPMLQHLRKLYRGDGDPDANKGTISNALGSPVRSNKRSKAKDDADK